MKAKHKQAMHQFYMDYIGPTLVIDPAQVNAVSRQLKCPMTLELDAAYNLHFIADHCFAVKFAMELEDNHVGVIHGNKAIDVHENVLLVVMLIVRTIIFPDTPVKEKEARMIQGFTKAITEIKESINEF